MSHLVKVDVQIKDIDAAKAAAHFMGWEFVEDAKQFNMWGNEKIACDHKMVIPDCKYEVGLVKSECGTHFVPTYDDMAHDYVKGQRLRADNGMAGFLPAYQKEKVRRHLKRKGLRFTESVKDGKTQFKVTA